MKERKNGGKGKRGREALTDVHEMRMPFGKETTDKNERGQPEPLISVQGSKVRQ